MRTHLHTAATFAAVVISVASMASTAFAQISLNTSLNANVTAGNGSVNANANANASSAHSTSSANANANSHATTSLGQTVSAIVSGGANKNAAADIDAQIKTIKASDSNVASVKTDDDSVTVSYKVPGRVFGIFPGHVNVKVTTDASGKTEVHYPWYAKVENKDSLGADFQARHWTVTSSNKVDIIVAIETALKAWLNSNASASATTTASASTNTQ